MNEDKVLEWLVENKSTGEDDDVINDVTLGLLNTLIDSVDHLAVIFCKLNTPGPHYTISLYTNFCQY